MFTIREHSRFVNKRLHTVGKDHSKMLAPRETFMLARLAAYFAKLWSAVAIEPPLWEGGGSVIMAPA